MRLARLTATVVVCACRSEAVTAPAEPDASSMYWALRFEQSAVALSLAQSEGSFRLLAVPISASGTSLDGLPAPTYTSGNTDLVVVDRAGVVTPRRPTSGVQVIARLTANGITHVDTATISVTEDPPSALATFSIQPAAGDSAKFALGGSVTEPFRTLMPLALDEGGNPIAGLPVHFRSLDQRIATVDPWSGTITGVGTGTAPIAASTYAYGTAMADTVLYRIGLPLQIQVIARDSNTTPGSAPNWFSPTIVRIGMGGVVHWWNTYWDEPIDVVFDDPTHVVAATDWSYCALGVPCDAGDIPAFGAASGTEYPQSEIDSRRARRFTAPGIYHYRSTIFGTEGVIEVVDESE